MRCLSFPWWERRIHSRHFQARFPLYYFCSIGFEEVLLKRLSIIATSCVKKPFFYQIFQGKCIFPTSWPKKKKKDDDSGIKEARSFCYFSCSFTWFPIWDLLWVTVIKPQMALLRSSFNNSTWLPLSWPCVFWVSRNVQRLSSNWLVLQDLWHLTAKCDEHSADNKPILNCCLPSPSSSGTGISCK